MSDGLNELVVHYKIVDALTAIMLRQAADLETALHKAAAEAAHTLAGGLAWPDLARLAGAARPSQELQAKLNATATQWGAAVALADVEMRNVPRR